MKQHPKVAIVYLQYYHNESFVDDAVSALKKMTYPKDKIAFVVVDNPHPEHGLFTRYYQDNVLPLSGKEIPEVVYLPQEENLGFAGGNNVGVDWAIENGYDYIYFHNNDGFFARHAIEPIVEAMEKDREIGIVQSMIMLHPETDKMNTSGNAFHYLGFGYSNHCWEKLKDHNFAPIEEVGYASGAAFMVRTDLTKEYGAWDHDFFLYHEDMEWSFRLRSLGYKIVRVTDSLFYHKYQFARSIGKFYWMERNRFAVWLMYFRWPTLLLLAPLALGLEIGLIYFALRGGWFKKRLDVYKYWLTPKHWKLWLKKRNVVQKRRRVTDRYMMSFATTRILFQDKSVDNPLVNYIANPIMTAYYYIVVKTLLWW